MAIEKEIISQINDWFKGDRNYNLGLSLLKEAGFSQRGLLKTLERGETKDNKLHLTYNLFKYSDYTDKKICFVHKKENSEAKVIKRFKTPSIDVSSFVNHDEIELSFKDGTQEAILLAKIIKKQKSNYNARAQAHKEMTNLGDSNDDKIVSKRKEFLSLIKNYTSVVDYLHNIKLKWKQTGIMPDKSVLDFEGIKHEEQNILLDVEKIPEVDLHNELAKVRSRLSKYPHKMKVLSGKKLDALKEKKAADEKLKSELIKQLNAVRSK